MGKASFSSFRKNKRKFFKSSFFGWGQFQKYLYRNPLAVLFNVFFAVSKLTVKTRCQVTYIFTQKADDEILISKTHSRQPCKPPQFISARIVIRRQKCFAVTISRKTTKNGENYLIKIQIFLFVRRKFVCFKPTRSCVNGTTSAIVVLFCLWGSIIR